ncbi:hypothetical protein SPRG_04952 [Saprolegnia parasitica CBS 223.65]|uniref:protein-tyrosine-phosphatase n=1 Tax=Saprolegnia parasitica (strain CBS 223.65) TaxID=695850 RepID=A0A067CKZ6_SAPPC|nr:hypothetical protein SPRG_04952 [Saprolegnia parasitica CBS 223.65]KDO29885.1 hypothetical protein SPRG_04952 [Saprolegnia parasitica CBS 223.65]|eukprot:XP_012199480.1 hypothetical protein SPRG_04952 [Saprolegnia parasitica CBS 223.65]
MLAELEQRVQTWKVQWASEILPGLWLGSGSAASKLESLQRQRITHVLNVADDVPNFHPNAFLYGNLGVTDFGQDVGIRRVFPTAFAFLDDALAHDDGRVLVHCAAGANRSATVVLAYLMHAREMSLADAWAHVRSRRRGICPLRDNRQELLAAR